MFLKLFTSIYITSCFIMFVACKSTTENSNLRLARKEGAPLAKRKDGLKQLINWANGKQSTYEKSLNDFIIDIDGSSYDIQSRLEMSIQGSLLDEVKKISVLLSFNSVNNELPEHKREKEVADFTHFIHKQISVDDRYKILLEGGNLNWKLGEVYRLNIGKFLLAQYFFEGSVNLFSHEELRSSLAIIIKKAKLNGQDGGNLVRYNGQTGRHEYFDFELQKAVDIVSLFAIRDSSTFKKYVIENEEIRLAFTRDTNTIDDLSRAEPFDLIGNRLSRLYALETLDYSKDRDQQNAINLSLKVILGIPTTSHSELLVIKNDKKSRLDIYCFPTETSEVEKLFHLSSFSNSELYDKDSSYQQVDCNGKTYSVEVGIRKSITLLPPKPFEETIKNKSVFKVKTYVTLANEIAPIYLNAFINVAGFHGFRKVSDKIVKSVSHFEDNLKDADMLIYAGHVLSAGDLDIGSTSNRSIIFEGKRNGKTIQIEMVIPYQGPDTKLSKVQLTDMYRNRLRDKTGEDPLFVFVTSCTSSSNVTLWPAIHRNAIEDFPNYQSRLDMPYVIASYRGFDTSSSYEIISHVFYPIDVIDLATKGKSIDEINDYLASHEYGDLVKESKRRTNFLGKSVIMTGEFLVGTYNKAKNILSKIWKNNPASSEAEAFDDYGLVLDKTFDPAYNLSDEYRESTLNIGGIRVEIKDPSGEIVTFIDL